MTSTDESRLPSDSRITQRTQPPTNPVLEPAESSPPPYTTFSRWQIRYLTYFLGYLTLASSLTATIYFPLISLLATRYHVSIQAINLTITLYVVFQGIAPSFFSPLSDTLGRRPVLLGTFTLYTVASLGLAFSGHSYVALLLLRAVQSIGGSAIMSLAYAVVADISVHSERGRILGPLLASTNLGPCIGPVIGGGAILASGNPRWCFWALFIFGGVATVLIGWTMPETGRNVVGNGTAPARGVWKTWWALFTGKKSSTRSCWSLESKRRVLKNGNASEDRTLGDSLKSNNHSDDPHAEGGLVRASSPGNILDVASKPSGRGKLSIPNPFISLRLIFYWDTSLILWLAGSPYALWYMVQTSIPLIYGTSDAGYGFNDLYVGLCFLAGGSGVICGGFVAGRLMDWNYAYTARQAGLPLDKRAGDDMRTFPIEHARSRGSLVILALSACIVIGYGWAVDRMVHPAVPLVLQFFIGGKCTVLHQIYSTLLVDIFSEKTGTAAASNNIVRCALSAGVVAALQPLVTAIGRGWVFTLVGLVDWIVCSVAVVLLRRWGKRWRDRRIVEATI